MMLCYALEDLSSFKPIKRRLQAQHHLLFLITLCYGLLSGTLLAAQTPDSLIVSKPKQDSTIYAIDVGGKGVESFAEDRYGSGGRTATTADSIDLTGVESPAPPEVYQSWRSASAEEGAYSFTYTFSDLRIGRYYKVRLHFAENELDAAGERIFNVYLNQEVVLQYFDIFSTAGGKNKGLITDFTVTPDSAGQVSILFLNVRNNAQVNGIEVKLLPNAAGYSVNSGGNAEGTFSTDNYYTFSSAATTADSIDLSGAESPAPMEVYQSWRNANAEAGVYSFAYSFPNLKAGGQYQVRLHFAENELDAAGERIFNVYLNQEVVLQYFDIFAYANGHHKALLYEFTTTADSLGTISILFLNVRNNAQVNGIEIREISEKFEGTYTLTAKHSGLLLDVSGASMMNGGKVIQWEPNGGDNQLWEIEPVDEEYYILKAKHSGKVLDVTQVSLEPGTRVIQWEINGGDNQKWKIEPVEEGYYILRAKHSGMVLQVADSSLCGGALVQQSYFTGKDNQKWKLEPASLAGARRGVQDRLSLDKAEEFLVYPNPATDQVYITLPAFEQQKIRIEITNARAEMVDIISRQAASHQTLTFTVNHLPTGLYFFNIYREGEPKGIRRKLLVKR